MSISQIVLRGHKAPLLVALAFTTIACGYFSKTYDPHIQSLSLPPGVYSEPSQFRRHPAIGLPGPGYTRSRLGKCAGCQVQVEIRPLGDTREVNPVGKVMPPTGRPVAKIVNHDPTYFEDMYGFRPLSQFEYYVWVDTAGIPSTARMTLLEVPAAGQPGVVRAIFQKNLMICRDGHSAPPTSDADFRWCPGVHVSAGVSVTHAGMWGVVPPFAALLSRVNEFIAGKLTASQPPIWLRCMDGCCG